MGTSGRWKWLALPAAALLVGAILAIVIFWPDRGPRKPDPIPAGDYTYAGALADHLIERTMAHLPGSVAGLFQHQTGFDPFFAGQTRQLVRFQRTGKSTQGPAQQQGFLLPVIPEKPLGVQAMGKM